MDDDLRQEAELFNPQHMLLENIERRRELDRLTTAGAEVVFDLQSKGPLYRYVLARRARAVSALDRLIDVDPKDAVAIATAQLEVKEYVQACRWIEHTFSEAQTADQMIHDEFPEGGAAQGDDASQ